MTDVVFRPARESDLPAIVALLADDTLGASRDDPSPPLHPDYLAAFAAIAASPHQLLAVAERDGAVIGTLQLSFLPGLSNRGAWRGQIESVRIAGHLRGGGLGRRMMEWALEECRQRGCATAQLTTHNSRRDAHRFYERLGFVATHAGYKKALTPAAAPPPAPCNPQPE